MSGMERVSMNHPTLVDSNVGLGIEPFSVETRFSGFAALQVNI